MSRGSCLWCFGTALVFVAISSCSFGLQPLSSKNDTVVALRLSGVKLPDNAAVARDGRAIVQGSGYLYMRTLGGPTGDAGPFYGPYAVTSNTKFKTDDIPAGAYSDIALLFSANPISETTGIEWKGATYSFSQLMRLPDAEWKALVNDDADPFTGLFDGETSTGMTGAITVKENKTTNLSVVLIPATDAAYYLDFASATARTLPAQASMVRKFYEIGGLGATLSASEFEASCTITPGSAPLTLGIVALYASDGTTIKNFGSIGSLTAAKTLTATVKKAEYYFLYIEYQSAEPIALGFTAAVKTEPTTPVEPPPVGSGMTVSVTGDVSMKNRTFYYSVYDLTSYISDPELLTYIYGPIGTLCGYGAIALDGSGNGSGTAQAIGGSPLSVSSTGMYVVYGFADMNSPTPRYAGTYAPGAALTAGQVKNIVPRTGDWWTEDPVSCMPAVSTTVSITTGELVMNDDAVYFVSTDGNGDRSGLTYENCARIADTIGNINSSEPNMTLYLAESISLSTTAYFQFEREIAGAPGLAAPPTINVTSLGGNLLKNSGSGDSLLLHDITIEGPGPSPAMSESLISVGDTQLILGDKCLIENFGFTSAVIGGAVRAHSGSSVIMLGNASINKLSAAMPLNGGGLYLDASVLYMFNTSSIKECTGWQNGGALYLTGTGSTAILSDSSLITGCSATIAGGGVFLTGTATSLSLAGSSSIAYCAANSGGAIHDDGNTVSLNGDASGSGVIITECDAVNGGGVYLLDVPAAQFTVSGKSAITVNRATGTGGGVVCSPTAYTQWTDYVPAYIHDNTPSDVEPL